MSTFVDAKPVRSAILHEPVSPNLAELLDGVAVQSLLEDFYALTRIPASITDTEGNLVVGVGWQDICLHFHRARPESCRNCIESDTDLTRGVPEGECRLYKCKNNMWDIATPIVVGGNKLGNLFSGQFFFADEVVDTDLFRSQANRYGFDEPAYVQALQRAPRLERTVIDKGMAFLIKLANMLSLLGYRNMELARSLEERQALADSLKESGDLLNAAEAMAHVGSWKLDLVANCLSWSDEVYRIFGLQPQEFGATYEAFLKAVHPDDRAAVNAAYSDSVREGRCSYEITHRVIRSCTGEVRWVHEKCTHVTDAQGAIIRSVGMVQDVTEAKQAEEELRRNNRELTAANRAWEEFAFAVSHDLQEPLRTIKIYAQMLLRRTVLKDDNDALRFAAFIETGVDRLEDLLRDLLSYVCAAEAERNGKHTDLNRCFDSAVEALRSQIEETGAVVKRSELPVVLGHRGQLTRLLQNLLSNAMKYRRHGVAPEVTVTASRESTEWVIRVRDNGIGFDPRYADRIFGLFKRLHRSAYPGTGVGLAICRRIVEHHGGRIWAESEGTDRGATFAFALTGPDGESNDHRSVT